MDAWNPTQYERFKAERSRPFHDLLEMVEPRPALRVLDLGCGTGELTRHMHQSLAATETIGLESSEEMLRKSSAHLAPGLRFEQRDIREAEEFGTFDLVFSNAALHWLPDHGQLLRDLRMLVRPGGQLAVQVPANHAHASQTQAARVAETEPFRGWLSGFTRKSPVLEPEEYALVLGSLGLEEVCVLQRVYLHELPDRDAVVEWVRGTTLTAYEERLSPSRYEEFLQAYRELLLPQLSSQKPFLFPFKRTFLTARC